MYIDTHCHPYLSKKKVEHKILENYKRSDGKYLISIGTDLQTSQTSITLSEKYDFIYSTIGIHPTDIDKNGGDREKDMKILDELYQKNNKIVGIGETGLDYYRIDKENFEQEKQRQSDYFRDHIRLAKKYNLPFIIHNRDSGEDVLKILKEENYGKFIFHCFSENLDYALDVLSYFPDALMSFSGIVTFKNTESIQETAKNIPLKNILIETDSPFLTPSPYRGKEENEPNFVKYVLEKIIELRSENPHVIEKQIYENSIKIFSL